jgi:hypothetical protein
MNSALKVLLGTDIFPLVPKKKVKICCSVKYVNIHVFSLFITFSLAVTKKPWLMEKNYLIFEFGVKSTLSGLDIFPGGTKKKLNCVVQCNESNTNYVLLNGI